MSIQPRPSDELEGSLLPPPPPPVVETAIASSATNLPSISSDSETPIAIAVPVSSYQQGPGSFEIDSSADATPGRNASASRATERTRYAHSPSCPEKDEKIPSAQVIPTYDDISSQFRNDADDAEVKTAEGIARIRDIEGKIREREGRKAAPSKVLEEEEAARAANEEACRRDREGVQLREDKWFQNNGVDPSDGATMPDADVVSYKKSGGGYEVADYDTSEYACKEYKADYEYKSVYE